jgi:hypothetical protein
MCGKKIICFSELDVSPDQSVNNKSNNVSFGLHDHSHSGAEDDSSVEVAKKPEGEDAAANRKKSSNDTAENDVFEEPSDLVKSELNNDDSTDKINAYLCIKVNKNKDFMYCPLDRKMKNKLTSEFWFQITENR